ncbi:MAG: Error-prone repair protein ImuA [Bacteroidota bacterium]|jgi:protein ImuA|nr:MAG: Error-prone repair protein ImuA [Bacteroidota bacterium]
MHASVADRIKDLKAQIMRLEGFKSATGTWPDTSTRAFPWRSFPLGAVHEFLCGDRVDVSPTAGFIAGLLSHLYSKQGVILWISASRRLFPPALAAFGLRPECVIFLDAARERDVTWAMEEALKCPALSAVVGEIRDLDFTASRRLQLAVERSCVTGFVIRKNLSTINTTACVSRWRITSLPGATDDDMPGVGFPVWKIELLRMRNGQPGCWVVRWMNEEFVEEQLHVAATAGPERKAI